MSGKRLAAIVSLVAYAIGGACYEPVMLLPAFLLLAAVTHERSPGWRRGVRVLSAHGVVMAAFGAFMLFHKAARPEVQLGANTLVNLSLYADRALRFFPAATGGVPAYEARLTGAHALGAVLLAVALARGRWRAVVLGAGAFLLLHLPTLGLVEHVYWHHTYVPQLGVLLVLATVVDELVAARGLGRGSVRAMLGALLLVMTVACAFCVRRLEGARLAEHPGLAESFVVRHAALAQRVFDGMAAMPNQEPRSLTLLYHRPEGRTSERAYVAGVRNAVSGVSGPRLYFDDLRLPVEFGVVGDPIPEGPSDGREVYWFDELGNLERRTPSDAPVRPDVDR